MLKLYVLFPGLNLRRDFQESVEKSCEEGKPNRGWKSHWSRPPNRCFRLGIKFFPLEWRARHGRASEPKVKATARKTRGRPAYFLFHQRASNPLTFWRPLASRPNGFSFRRAICPVSARGAAGSECGFEPFSRGFCEVLSLFRVETIFIKSGKAAPK